MPNTVGELVEDYRSRIRSPRSASLAWAYLGTLIALALQLGLGMIVNLYVQVPAADAQASYIQEIRTAPFGLTVHAVLGTLLLCASVAGLAGAVRARDRLMIASAGIGLAAVAGAFTAGELFVRNGDNSVSLTMALLTGLAIAAYAGALARAKAVV